MTPIGVHEWDDGWQEWWSAGPALEARALDLHREPFRVGPGMFRFDVEAGSGAHMPRGRNTERHTRAERGLRMPFHCTPWKPVCDHPALEVDSSRGG